jgi:hypothetical protein
LRESPAAAMFVLGNIYKWKIWNGFGWELLPPWGDIPQETESVIVYIPDNWRVLQK